MLRGEDRYALKRIAEACRHGESARAMALSREKCRGRVGDMKKNGGHRTDLKIVRGNRAAVLRAVMNAIIPRGGAFAPGASDYDLLPGADEMLARYDPGIRALFPLMLAYIQYTALLRTGRVFTRLDEKRGAEFLSSMEKSPFFYRRTIILLMKLVTMLSFYEDDEMSRFTGYRHGCHLQ